MCLLNHIRQQAASPFSSGQRDQNRQVRTIPKQALTDIRAFGCAVEDGPSDLPILHVLPRLYPGRLIALHVKGRLGLKLVERNR